ncbi:MAG TPA: ABC transporter ATP-binding protein [Anaerolineales bacterium]|nr:ABC transporter ATP-binding protein [Anaerolineales bacterium]
MDDFAVVCRGLTKTFDGEIPAVYDLDLEVREGEILALLGPSGCGKTTTLRLIAGFIRPDAGEIAIAGRMVAGGGRFVPPEKRGVGMVFQEHALFPHLTAAENIAFGLDGKDSSRQIAYLLRLTGLERFGDRYPHELSGGERQRVALARALATKPVLILLDEPFSNLDADRRAQVREDVRAILKATGSTAVFVTHDQEEALFLGDRLAVMDRGRIVQTGAPDEIFHTPQTRFVAEFIGSTDFLPGVVREDGVETEIGLLDQRLDLPPGTEVEVAVRFDDVVFEQSEAGESMVLARHFKGAYNIYRLRLPSGRLLHAMKAHTELIRPGTPVRIRLEPGHPLACYHLGQAVANRK